MITGASGKRREKAAGPGTVSKYMLMALSPAVFFCFQPGRPVGTDRLTFNTSFNAFATLSNGASPEDCSLQCCDFHLCYGRITISG